MMNNRKQIDEQKDEVADQDAEINMLMEMGFEANQAKLAMEADSGDVDEALDDLMSGIRFSSKDVSPKPQKKPLQSTADDEMVKAKHMQHSGGAVSIGIISSGSSQVLPPRTTDKETKSRVTLQCPSHVSSTGISSTASPVCIRSHSTKGKVKPNLSGRAAAGSASGGSSNHAAELGDKARVGAVAVAGPGRDVETGNYSFQFDPTEQRDEQAREGNQSDEPIVAELVPPPEAERVLPEAYVYASKTEPSHPYWTKNRIIYASLVLLLIVGAAVMGTILAQGKNDDAPNPNIDQQSPNSTVTATEGPTVAPTPAPTDDPNIQTVHAQGESEQRFGDHVSISRDGTTIASGAEIGNYVEVFRRVGGSWNRVGDRLKGVTAGEQFGRCVGLNEDGSVLVVGAWNNDDAYLDAGNVKVYRLEENTWKQVGQTLVGDAIGDRFGWYVSMADDGKTIAASARLGDPRGIIDAGYVRVFTLDSDNEWTQLGADLEGELQDEWFGKAMAISSDGRRLAVGTINWDGKKGIVRVFDYLSGSWIRVGQVLTGEEAQDQFGTGVALSADGNILAVGADEVDTADHDKAGSVRVFHFDGSEWNQLGQVIVGEGNGGKLGMHKVALSDDGYCLAAGANLIKSEEGIGYIYEFKNNKWKQVVALNGNRPQDRFGESMSVSGDCSVVVFGASEKYTIRPGYFKVYSNDHK